MKAIEHIAERIEEAVAALQKQQMKRKTSKKKGHGHGNSSAVGMPKLDHHDDDYSSGFYSEYSTKVAGDLGLSPNPPMQSASYDAGDDLGTPESQGGADLDVSAEVTTTPQQDNMCIAYLPFTGCSEVVEETPEENRTLQATEKINRGVAETVPYRRSDSGNSRPVFSSQQSGIIEGYDNIHRVVESEKRKAQDVIMEKDDTINHLQRQLRIKEDEQFQERKKHEDEMKQKEEELLRSVADIEQKSHNIESLKKAHEQQMKELEDNHRAKVEKITRELEEKSKLAQQKMEALEQDLQKARDEKIALEKQKSQAEKEIEKLKSEHEKCLQEEKNNYESEIEKLKIRYDGEIRKLEALVEKEKSDAKHKEDFINMSHKCKLAELELKYKDDIATLKEKIHDLKQEKTEADAQARICKAQMETQKERAAKEMAQMQAQVDAKEADIKIHRAMSENQLALRQQAQEHEREKKEIITSICNTRRSISSSPSTSSSITEELRMSFLQMDMTVTRSNSGQSDESKQETPNEECEEQSYSQ